MTRRRFVYRPNPDTGEVESIEVPTDWEPEARGAKAPVTDLYMDGVRATDGTDIGSRTKRREYMRANNLADTDDFKGTWEKAAKEREAIRTGKHDVEARREAIARACYQKGLFK